MTDDELFELALRGGESGWQDLHQRCRERRMAERLARVLEQGSSQESDEAQAWASVLKDLHPDLKISLPPRREPSPEV